MSRPYFAQALAIGMPVRKMIAAAHRIEASPLVKPYVKTIDAPIAKSARYAMPPSAVPATIDGDQRRKECGAYRSE